VRAVVLSLLVAGCASEPAPAPPTSGHVAFDEAAPRAAGETAGKPTPAGAIRYLALGDSFTIGTGSSPAQAFPARLAARLREGGAEVALENLGVNGFTTDDLIEVELPRVRAFAPTVVTLAIGANDLVHGTDVAAYRRNVRRILAELASARVPAARVVCIPQPDWARSPVARDFGDPDRLEKEIDRFNESLRDEATRAGARYVDLTPLFREEARQKLIAPDGLHPSAAAHDAWAAAIAPHLPR
jgi:acyl-CoA thioesterase I